MGDVRHICGAGHYRTDAQRLTAYHHNNGTHMTLAYKCSNCGTVLQTTNADPLNEEIVRLRMAAGKAASILSRHLSHQLSNQESYKQLREARDGLVATLSDAEQPKDK